MALFEITAASCIVDVSFAKDGSSMAVLHNLGLDIYSCQTSGTRFLAPKPLSKIDFESSPTRLPKDSVLQVSVGEQGRIHVLRRAETLEITTYTIQPASGVVVLIGAQPATSGSAITTSISGSGLFVQDRSGKLFQLRHKTLDDSQIQFPMQLPWVEITTYAGEPLAFGLSRSGQLYVNSRLLVKNCTSFVLTQDHLVLTTSNHLLKFIHLDTIEGELASILLAMSSVLTKTDIAVPPDDPENDERCRSLERGAKLVTVIPTNMRVILQMPRGNLETIYPRAMVVAGIRRLIDEKEYGRAFSCCRTQRVDMNILYDHKPDQFLANVGKFLYQLHDVSYIDLFLSSLR